MGTLYLSADPSFCSGIARVFDFGGTFNAYNHAATGAQADGIGILWDWAIVGNDLWGAVHACEDRLNIVKLQTEPELVTR